MPDNETLKRWGDTACRYVRLEGENVVIRIDADAITIGPIQDTTERKAMWADAQWIVARLLETGAETVERDYEHTKDLILAGERIVGFLRGVLEHKDYVTRSTTLALCLASYDEAKRRRNAPSAYDHLRDRNALEGEPAPAEPPSAEKSLHDQPSIPEPETEVLYQVLFHWRRRQRIAEDDMRQLESAYMAINPNPQDPCPDNLARAYTRFFKAKNVVNYLEAAIHEQLGEHLSTIVQDDTTFPSEMRFQIQTRVAATPLTTRPLEGFTVTPPEGAENR
jgi:hypothetical protein